MILTRRKALIGALGLIAAPALVGRAKANLAANPVNLMEAIRLLGLTANLRCCLDARVVASYPGSGNKWLDLSGNGVDFFKGTDGTTAAPTFTGTAGMPSAYFLCNGSQYFTYDAANESWMNAMHQSGNISTIVLIGLFVTTASTALMGTNGGLTSGTGFNHTMAATPTSLVSRVRNAGAQVMPSATSTLIIENSVYQYIGVNLDAPAGASGGYVRSSGGSGTFDSTYTTPAAGAASQTLQIGAVGGGLNIVSNLTRFVAVAFWQGGAAITPTQHNLLRQLTRQPIGR